MHVCVGKCARSGVALHATDDVRTGAGGHRRARLLAPHAGPGLAPGGLAPRSDLAGLALAAYFSVSSLLPGLVCQLDTLAGRHYEAGRIDEALRNERFAVAVISRNPGTGADSPMLERAIELEPNDVGAWLKLARWRESEGYTDEGKRLRARALAIVGKYRHRETLTEYEAVLLGQPGGIRGNGGAGD